MEGNPGMMKPRDDETIERNTTKDELQQTPTKRMCYITNPQ